MLKSEFSGGGGIIPESKLNSLKNALKCLNLNFRGGGGGAKFRMGVNRRIVLETKKVSF